MSEKQIKVLKVSSSAETHLLTIEEMVIDNCCESFYKVMGCRHVDFIESGIHGVDIIVDDEGLYDSNIPTLYFNGVPIMGTVLFAGIDYSTGESISLSDENIKSISNLEWGIFIFKNDSYQLIKVK